MRGAGLFLFLWLSAAGATTCDVYELGGTPCVAAHSTTRALYKGYAGAEATIEGKRFKIVTEEGVRALWVGSFPRILRRTLQQAMTWSLYEHVAKLLGGTSLSPKAD